MKHYFQIQNDNIITFLKKLLEMLNATWNASENARLQNTQNLLISILTWLKR